MTPKVTPVATDSKHEPPAPAPAPQPAPPARPGSNDDGRRPNPRQ